MRGTNCNTNFWGTLMIWKVFEFADVKIKVNKWSTIFTFGGILVFTFAGKLTSHKHIKA
jgi:hypothetical protein